MSENEPYAGSDFQKSARGLAIGVVVIGLAIGEPNSIGIAIFILIAARPAHFFIKMNEASDEKKRAAQMAARDRQMAEVALAEEEDARQEQQQKMEEMRSTATIERASQQVSDSIQTIESAIRTLAPEKDNATMLTTISNELKALHRNSDLSAVFDRDPSLSDDLAIAQKAYAACGVNDPFVERYFSRLVPNQDFIR